MGHVNREAVDAPVRVVGGAGVELIDELGDRVLHVRVSRGHVHELLGLWDYETCEL